MAISRSGFFSFCYSSVCGNAQAENNRRGRYQNASGFRIQILVSDALEEGKPYTEIAAKPTGSAIHDNRSRKVHICKASHSVAPSALSGRLPPMEGTAVDKRAQQSWPHRDRQGRVRSEHYLSCIFRPSLSGNRGTEAGSIRAI